MWSWRRGSRSLEHIGSAHDDAELAALKAAAAQRLAAGQTELDFGPSGVVGLGALPILSSQMTHLWDGLCAAYRLWGFELATEGDNVFRDLVLARIVEPTSKLDAAREKVKRVDSHRVSLGGWPRSTVALRLAVET